jgi:hypothetical protein
MQLGPTQDVEKLKLRITALVGWLIRITPTCSQVVRLVSEDMDHPLPLGMKIRVRLHFLICKWCEQYRQQLLFLRNALRQHPDKLAGEEPSTGLSPEARERLAQALRKKQRET